MYPNISASELVGVVAVIDPDAYTAGAQSTGWIDASRYQQFMAIVMAGDLGTNGTIDAKFEQATSSGGAGAKDISGAAITQFTEAGTDSNKQAIVSVRTQQFDVNGGFCFVRLTMTVATATSDAGAIVLGFGPRYSPVSSYDAASVDEIA